MKLTEEERHFFKSYNKTKYHYFKSIYQYANLLKKLTKS
ncbi:hypothetical protein STRUR_0092 [Streptococcus urinalis 2285-97]|uniref:Uncharacterized protein n=1 Tax=Streptococcus urinalis 2285-97 TaxID=764291 RepID=G5KGS0_9STRE|nr:hypothetical protein STRUR_0092 [Streptococcus urinalis 2285-97]